MLHNYKYSMLYMSSNATYMFALLMLASCALQEQQRGLKYPQSKDYLNYVRWRQTVHFKKLDNPKVGA